MFELDGDSFYDVRVTLNSINNSKANVSFIYVHEEVVSLNGEEDGEPNVEGNSGEEMGKNNRVTGAVVGTDDSNGKRSLWPWMIGGILIIVGVGLFFFFKIRSVEKQRGFSLKKSVVKTKTKKKK